MWGAPVSLVRFYIWHVNLLTYVFVFYTVIEFICLHIIYTLDFNEDHIMYIIMLLFIYTHAWDLMNSGYFGLE